ncbi:SH3 domain-containing kinase-binding protein 1 [Armadillidium nasatum]|uniref:SH3 domain-containing kinase-binding protein 1 n=1 Tax=Armadillidium nasatum TaxID=96803 RepID=A0A5N5TPW2_9CRUS|nr:SH3 domain-containing kinase-binding protein 1 [Armadillidium nasatum]
MDIEVEVIHPYNPQEDDELHLRVGDIITNVEYLEKGWCKGVLNNVSGAFPDNFVRTIVRGKKNKTEDGRLKPSSSPSNVNERKCNVIFSYVPQHEDELALKEGDVVVVLEEVEEGWWKGILGR